MIFSIDLVENKTFILKCFIQFPCTNLDGCQKEGGVEANFFNLLQKDGGTQKREVGPTLRKLWCIIKMQQFKRLPKLLA